MRAKRAWRAVLGAPLGGVRFRHDYEVVSGTTIAAGGGWWIYLRGLVVGGKNDGREIHLDVTVPDARRLRDRLSTLIEEAEAKEGTTLQ